jgi:hypothetical protein
MSKPNLDGWLKCPTTTTGGKPYFWYNAEHRTWVRWNRLTRSWQVFNATHMPLLIGKSYHYKSDTSALNAANRMFADDASKAKTS